MTYYAYFIGPLNTDEGGETLRLQFLRNKFLSIAAIRVKVTLKKKKTFDNGTVRVTLTRKTRHT